MSSGTYPGAVIAKLLKVSERRIQQLARAGTIPKAKRGEYELVGCIHGYIDYLQQLAHGRTAEAAVDRNRLLKAQADKAELEYRMLMREVIPVIEVEEEWVRILKSLQSRLLALPMRLVQAAKSNPDQFAAEADVRALLQDELTELSTHDPQRGNTSPHASSVEGAGPAAATDDQPVGRPVSKAK